MTLDEKRERDRFTVVKILKADGYRFFEMVPKLREMGLLGCQNCDDPEYQRRTRDGGSVCTTCENTLNQEWHRNVGKLAEDDASMLEAKWRWEEAHLFAARILRRNAVRKVKVGEKFETHVNVEALRLYATVMDKLAKFRGVNVNVPLKPSVDRRKATIVRHRGAAGDADEITN